MCVHCGAGVVPVTNGSVRNHCPFCLWSLHVDDSKPGDRRSSCRSPMKPIDLLKNKKGWQVLHRCTTCHKQQANIVATDTVQDDMAALIRFMRAQANGIMNK